MIKIWIKVREGLTVINLDIHLKKRNQLALKLDRYKVKIRNKKFQVPKIELKDGK